MATPKISILMCVYNGECYLRDAIDSVLAQTFDDFEFLVIDDGSTDGSLDIVSSYSDPRIRLLKNERNLGLVLTRNKGLANSTGKYIAILDCDDLANPERLAKQFDFMESNQAFGMVGSWIETIDANGKPTGVMRYPAKPEEIPALLLFGNYFAQSAVLIRRNSLPDACYRSQFPVAEDYDLWVRMASVSKLWNIQEVLTRYRVHNPSASFSRAELMEQCVEGIISNQLLSMGLEPSDGEMNTHRNIGSLRFESTTKLIHDAESWLKKLSQANKTTNTFNALSFDRILGQKWYLVCRESSGIGFDSFRLFRKSYLHKLSNLNLWPQIKFLVRCAMKWQRKR